MIRAMTSRMVAMEGPGAFYMVEDLLLVRPKGACRGMPSSLGARWMEHRGSLILCRHNSVPSSSSSSTSVAFTQGRAWK